MSSLPKFDELSLDDIYNISSDEESGDDDDESKKDELSSMNNFLYTIEEGNTSSSCDASKKSATSVSSQKSSKSGTTKSSATTTSSSSSSRRRKQVFEEETYLESLELLEEQTDDGLRDLLSPKKKETQEALPSPSSAGNEKKKKNKNFVARLDEMIQSIRKAKKTQQQQKQQSPKSPPNNNNNKRQPAYINHLSSRKKSSSFRRVVLSDNTSIRSTRSTSTFQSGISAIDDFSHQDDSFLYPQLLPLNRDFPQDHEIGLLDRLEIYGITRLYHSTFRIIYPLLMILSTCTLVYYGSTVVTPIHQASLSGQDPAVSLLKSNSGYHGYHAGGATAGPFLHRLSIGDTRMHKLIVGSTVTSAASAAEKHRQILQTIVGDAAGASNVQNFQEENTAVQREERQDSDEATAAETTTAESNEEEEETVQQQQPQRHLGEQQQQQHLEQKEPKLSFDEKGTPPQDQASRIDDAPPTSSRGETVQPQQRHLGDGQTMKTTTSASATNTTRSSEVQEEEDDWKVLSTEHTISATTTSTGVISDVGASQGDASVDETTDADANDNEESKVQHQDATTSRRLGGQWMKENDDLHRITLPDGSSGGTTITSSNMFAFVDERWSS